MSKYECYQSQDTTQVIAADGSGAVVMVSRVVGSPEARVLMRLCAAVLNDDLPDAQRELDRLGDSGPSAEETITDDERAASWEISRLAGWLLNNTEGPALGESAVDLAIRLLGDEEDDHG